MMTIDEIEIEDYECSERSTEREREREENLQ